MENLFYQISQVLGITLLHSLWQGLIVYLVMRLVLQLIPELSSRLKYITAFAALIAMLGWFIDTLFIQINSYTWLSAALVPNRLPRNIVPMAITQWAAAPAGRYYFLIADYLPYVTALYLAGLAFNALRMLMALNKVHHIRKNVTATGYAGQMSLLSKKIGIHKYIQTSFSEYIDVPCITGVLKPIILLPLTITTYLTAEEVSAILLHEMAHIRRHDYLFNLIQQVIGILLFFNPFNILINRIINREREHSCDDIVIKITGTPLVYAQALLKLEEKHIQEWRLALTATGKKYHLLNRIERIMKTNKNTVNVRPVLIALMVLVCSLTSIAWLNPKVENGKISVKAITSPLRNFPPNNTTKRAVVKTILIQTAPVKTTTFKQANNAGNAQDTVLERLQAEVLKHANAIANYNSSAEAIQIRSETARPRDETGTNNTLTKSKLQSQIAQKQARLDQLNDDAHLKLLKQQLDEVSKKVQAYMTGPEFAKMTAKIEKLNDKMDNDNNDDGKSEQRTNKILAEINKVMQDFTNSSKIKPLTDLAKKLDAEIKAYYNQSEYVKTKNDLKAYNDSLKLYSAAQIQQQQAAIIDNQLKYIAEITREKEAMEQAQKELEEYRSRMNQQKKTTNR